MVGNKLAHEGIGIAAQLPDCLCGLKPVASHQLACLNPGTVGQLSTVAPGCAPADTVGIDNNHVMAGSGQVKGGGKASVARADDANIASDVVLQPVKRLGSRGRLGIPRVGVIAFAVIGVKDVQN